MIIFNECNLTDNNKQLVLDISVLDKSYYTNMYISKIYLDTSDNFINSAFLVSPSDKALTIWSAPSVIDSILNYKNIQTVFDVELLQNKLFYIWVECAGTLAADTPCGMRDTLTLAYAYNKYIFYKKGMQYIKEVSLTCSTSDNFKLYILQKAAFDLALETGNYILANKYWNLFTKNLGDSCSTVKHCNCYG